MRSSINFNTHLAFQLATAASRKMKKKWRAIKFWVLFQCVVRPFEVKRRRRDALGTISLFSRLMHCCPFGDLRRSHELILIHGIKWPNTPVIMMCIPFLELAPEYENDFYILALAPDVRRASSIFEAY